MATQRVNFASINDDALTIISDYMVARHDAIAIDSKYGPVIKALQTDIDGLTDGREKWLKENVKGQLTDAQVKYVAENFNAPIATKTAQLKVQRDAKRADLKPVNARLAKGRKIVKDASGLHDSYIVAQVKGTPGSTGAVKYLAVEKDKNGNAVTTVKTVSCDKSFVAHVKAFLENDLGMDVKGDKAVQKFANMLTMRVGGDVKARRSDTANLTTFKSKAVLSEMMLLVFIQVAFVENRAFVQKEDGSIVRKAF